MQSFYPRVLFLLFTLGTLQAYAQPSNDDCDNPIEIIDVSDWCSDVAAFTNEDATDSGYGPATCFSGANNDVWFTFTPNATDVTITVNGSSGSASGGTLNNPEIALYFGGCSGTLNQAQCETDNLTNNILELYKGGLEVGEPYLIRVQGRGGRTGSFQLCINNYNPPVQPGSDCIISSVLCNKDPFVVQQVSGPGNDPSEANDAPCLGTFGNVESNSTWFTWTAATNGTLEFTLTPLKQDDDLDFVLYQLPADPKNCSTKSVIRCMASGSFDFPSTCMGPTGLRAGADDLEEPPGCSNPEPQDNFLAPVDMIAGTSYALMVNNFSSSGNGFKIDFGGTGEFVGPQADFSADDPDLSICVGEAITFTDLSAFTNGVITDWEWDFGQGASPSTANVQGPHTISYDTPGIKYIVLTITTDRDCIETQIERIEVVCCDDHFTLGGTITNLVCPEDPTGAIDLDAVSNYPLNTYSWSNGEMTEDLFGLTRGEYTVTVVDQATCDTVITFLVNSPDTIDIDTLITMPTCGGGTDGAITLEVSGGVRPYEYSWENGPFGPDSTFTDIPRGDYAASVRDANGCTVDMIIPVRELELVLDPTVVAFVSPSCVGLNDGAIEVVIANGLPPYQYNFNDGNGYVDENSLLNIAEGFYVVDVLDANLCEGHFEFTLEDPPALEVDIQTTDASCNGLEDGNAVAFGSGGTGNYAFRWSNNQTGPEATTLAAGNYFITITDENNCETIEPFEILEPAPVFVNVIDVVDLQCNGAPTGVITVEGSGGSAPYEYRIDSLGFQTDSTFAGLFAGNYEIVVMDAQGCTSMTTASIKEPEAFVVDAGEDQVVELGYETSIRAVANQSIDSIFWFSSTPNDSLSCINCNNTFVRPFNTSTYTVAALNSQGCLAIDSVLVRVSKNRPIYIPNVFSPNGDGRNDKFTVFGGPGALLITTVKVFDRWGALVYEATDIPLNSEAFGWDGTFNGEEMSSGVFVYVVEVEFIDNQVVLFEGDIALIR